MAFADQPAMLAVAPGESAFSFPSLRNSALVTIYTTPVFPMFRLALVSDCIPEI